MKINIKYMLFVIVLYILVFQNMIQEYIVIFKYFDEFLALLGLIVVISKIILNKSKGLREDKTILFLLFLIFLLGIISNIKYDFQSLEYVLTDVILIFKFFLVYFLGKQTIKYEFLNKYKKKLMFHIKLIIMLLMILTILNYTVGLFEADYRFGILVNKLFYGHPTNLAAICIFLISILMLFEEKSKILFLVLIAILISTLRFKAIGAALMVSFLVFFIKKFNKKISFSKLLILGIIVTVVSWNAIMGYYIENDNTARNMLTKTSIKIASDYFPLGTGFGTFGSNPSREHYSVVYYMYKLNNVWGLSPKMPNFISDTFWPMLIGQLGIIATVFYSMCILIIFKRIQRDYNKSKPAYLSKIIAIMYLLISSTSEAAFVNPIAIPLAFIIGISLDNIEGSKKNEQDFEKIKG